MVCVSLGPGTGPSTSLGIAMTVTVETLFNGKAGILYLVCYKY